MQMIQWRLSSGQVEALVGGEVRTVAITLSTAPQSASVRVLRRSTSAEVVASTSATINGSVVSYLLSVPAGVVDTLLVVFSCVVGAETIAVAVEVPVTGS